MIQEIKIVITRDGAETQTAYKDLDSALAFLTEQKASESSKGDEQE